MKKISKIKLSAYTATAGAMGAMAPQTADALIVYFDVNPNQSVNDNGTEYSVGMYFGNINLGAATYTTGARVNLGFALYAGRNFYDGGGAAIQAEGVDLGAGGYNYLYIMEGATGNAQRFTSSASIGPGQYTSFVSDPIIYSDRAPGSYEWTPSATEYYLGMFTQNSLTGDRNYGWIALTLTQPGTDVYGNYYNLTISGFAFEKEVNTTITAGTTSGGAPEGSGVSNGGGEGGGSAVPEPGTAVSMLFGLAALAHLRARRNGQGGAPDSLLKLAYGAQGVEAMRSERG